MTNPGWGHTSLPLGILHSPLLNAHRLPEREHPHSHPNQTVCFHGQTSVPSRTAHGTWHGTILAKRPEPGLEVKLTGIRSLPQLNGTMAKMRSHNVDVEGYITVRVPRSTAPTPSSSSSAGFHQGESHKAWKSIKVKPRCVETPMCKSDDAPLLSKSRSFMTMFTEPHEVDGHPNGHHEEGMSVKASSCGTMRSTSTQKLQASFGHEKEKDLSDICRENRAEVKHQGWPMPKIATHRAEDKEKMKNPTDLEKNKLGTWQVGVKGKPVQGWAGMNAKYGSCSPYAYTPGTVN